MGKITENFKCIEVTDKILRCAEKINDVNHEMFGGYGTHQTHSDRQRMTGYIAEACVFVAYPFLDVSDAIGHDFEYDNLTIDVKAFGCNIDPRDDFLATIYEDQAHRKVDRYIFCIVKNNFSKCWIAPSISYDDYYAKAVLAPKGTQGKHFVYDQARYEYKFIDMMR